MVALLLLLTVGSTQAQDCETRVTGGEFHDRVTAVVEPVAFADPSALAELNALLNTLEGCIDGPAQREDVAALLLARGAFEILSGGPQDELARAYLLWAYAVGSRSAWEQLYGPQVESVFEEVSGHLLEKGQISFSFREEPVVILLDGESIAVGQKPHVSEGRHLVQWQLSTGWDGEFIEVVAGESIRVGDGRGGPNLSGLSERFTFRRNKYRTRWGPQPGGEVLLTGAYSLALAKVGHEAGAYRGALVFPSAGLDARLFVYRWLTIRLQADLGPGASAELPSLATGAQLLLGFGVKQPDFAWDVTGGPGLEWLPGDAVTSGDDGLAFEQDQILGGRIRGHLSIQDMAFDLALGIFDESIPVEASFRKFFGDGTFVPVVGVTAGRVGRLGTSIRRDRYGWVLLEGGLAWSY